MPKQHTDEILAGKATEEYMSYNRVDSDDNWRARAKCQEADPDLFFAPDGERGRALDLRYNAAKKVCGQCAVRLICLKTAIDKDESFGVWGGLNEFERQAVRAKISDSRRRR